MYSLNAFPELAEHYRVLLDADHARITTPLGKMFLIIGFNRRSKGEWRKNGEPIDFDYVEETVVASGDNEKELLASVNEYVRLQSMTMEQYLKERACTTT